MRLIDANRLKALLMVDFMQLELFGQKYKVSDALRTVDNTPTEDAVQVIRCSDCVYFSSEKSGAKWNMCRFHDSPKKENGFCDDAERKEQ